VAHQLAIQCLEPAVHCTRHGDHDNQALVSALNDIRTASVLSTRLLMGLTSIHWEMHCMHQQQSPAAAAVSSKQSDWTEHSRWCHITCSIWTPADEGKHQCCDTRCRYQLWGPWHAVHGVTIERDRECERKCKQGNQQQQPQ